MMKVLITGCNDGQLHWELQRCIPENIELITPDGFLDITDASSVSKFVNEQRPDWIINAAAYTAVDKAEVEKDLAFAVNVTGTENLATAAVQCGARLIHVSTDFVFGKSNATPFRTAQIPETDDPVSVYGQTKLQGEIIARSLLPEHSLIVRTAWVYSSNGNNFVKTMLRLMSEKTEIGVIADQIGSPTWANSLAVALWRAVEVNSNGIMHWTDAGVASWYDFAQAIMEEALILNLIDRPININPLRTDQYFTPAARPSYSVLELTSTWDCLQHRSEHWRVNLRKMLKEIQRAD